MASRQRLAEGVALVIAMALALVCLPAAGALASTQFSPPPDAAFSVEQRRQLNLSGQVLHAVGPEDRFQAITFRVATPVEAIWRTVRQFAQYERWFDELSKSDVYRQKGPDVYVRFQAEHWLAGSFVYHIHHHMPWPAASWARWRLDPTQASDFLVAEGYWRVESIAPGRESLVTYAATLQAKGFLAGLIPEQVDAENLNRIADWLRQSATQTTRK